MMFRVLQDLSTGHGRGSLVCGSRFNKRVRDALIKAEAIAPISAPPLDALTGWTLRAERLGAVGIDAMRFLELDDSAIAQEIGVDKRAVGKWREELHGWLGVNIKQKLKRP